MNKNIIGLGVACLVGISGMLTSCKLYNTNDNIATLSKEAGTLASVGWVAVNNPSVKEKQTVLSILDIVNEKASMVETGSTYYVVLYPELEKIIDKEIDSQYRPIGKFAVAELLGQLDLLFVTHPEWKKDQAIALSVVKSFVDGAKYGLSLSDDDPIVLQAIQNIKNKNLIKK